MSLVHKKDKNIWEDNKPGSTRIYIGGLDPNSLTVDEILTRLKDSIPKDNVIKDIHCSSQKSSASYFQFTVVEPSEDSNIGKPKPYEVIHKLFNNVKWKGCKLKVEKARPPFLQRLKQEIEERERSKREEEEKKKLQEEAAKLINCKENEVKPPALRRHMKVKRAFGQESWKVDTKPCLVTDWSSFHKMQKHLKRKREKFEEMRQKHQKHDKKNRAAEVSVNKNLEGQKAYYNRSIHLRFDSGAKQENKDSSCSTKAGEYSAEQSDEDAKMSTGSMSDSISDSDSSKSDSENESSAASEAGDYSKKVADSEENKATPKDNQAKGKYVWSDDESSSSNEDNKTDRIVVPNNDLEIPKETMKESTKDKLDAARDDNPSECGLSSSKDEASNRTKGKYVWSDDESSSSSKEDYKTDAIVVQPNNDLEIWKETLEKSTNDEFAAALDDVKSENGSSSSEDEAMDNNVNRTDDSFAAINNDLKQDVEGNLSILSQLFPDMTKLKPVALRDGDEGKEGKESGPKSSNATTGWGSSGQMLRYDPTREELKTKFLLESKDDRSASADDESSEDEGDVVVKMKGGDEDEDTTSSDSSGQGRIEKDVDSSKELGEGNNESEISKGHLFEQGKLEAVFQQARGAPKTPIIVLPNSEANNKSDSNFTFNFAVDEKKEKPAGTFSFGFDLDDKKEAKSSTFAFGFDLDRDKTQNEVVTSSKEPSDALQGNIEVSESLEDSDMDVDDSSVLQSKSVVRKRRPAFGFLDEKYDDGQTVLDRLVSFAYHDSLGGGECNKILSDLKAYRADPAVTEKWNDERQRLTRDWKRKRKVALTRKRR